MKKSASFPFVESFKRTMICPSWRCRGGDLDKEDENEEGIDEVDKNGAPNAEQESDQRKPSEVGRKIFVAAKNVAKSPVITRSPKPKEHFDDIITANNNVANEEIIMKVPVENGTKNCSSPFKFTKV